MASIRKEIIVDRNAASCWEALRDVGAPFQHHNASVQVFEAGSDRARLVWIADLLPNELAVTIREMIEQAMGVMKVTLERR